MRIETTCEVIHAMLSATIVAMSKDITRFHICGLQIKVLSAGKIQINATDGHRLHRVENDFDVQTELDGAFTMPAALAESIVKATKGRKAPERCVITYDAYTLAITFTTPLDGASVAGKAVDSTFPPTDAVMPRPDACLAAVEWGVNPKYFADLAKVAKALRSDDGMKVRITGALDPIRVELRSEELGIEFTGVVMPMRIK